MFGQSEIEHLDDALLGDHNIVRFEVAVGDALGVSGVQRVEDLAGVLNGLVDTEGPLSGAPSMHSITR